MKQSSTRITNFEHPVMLHAIVQLYFCMSSLVSAGWQCSVDIAELRVEGTRWHSTNSEHHIKPLSHLNGSVSQSQSEISTAHSSVMMWKQEPTEVSWEGKANSGTVGMVDKVAGQMRFALFTSQKMCLCILCFLGIQVHYKMSVVLHLKGLWLSARWKVNRGSHCITFPLD